MAWLVRSFGEARLRSTTVITPTAEFLPVDWNATHEEVLPSDEKISALMGLDFNEIALEYYEGDDRASDLGLASSTPAGTYQESEGKFLISYNEEQLADPLNLCATLAHEYAHIHLIGHKRISGTKKITNC